jgi:flavin-dependent dehydrogenase
VTAPVIIGGGPAGSSAAIELARAGCPTTLIERTAAATDKVCGDFLSPEAAARIEALGVALTDAQHIDSLRLVHRRRVVQTRLPFAALGLSRRALDERLLHQATAAGTTVLRGHRVSTIEGRGGTLQVVSRSLGEIVTDTVFLATGKHELRGNARRAHPSNLVALKMYCRLDPSQLSALRGHIELMLLPGGYAGLQLIERDCAVVCMLLPAAYLPSAGGHWATLIDLLAQDCPHLADRLSGAETLLDRPLAIAKLPYGYVFHAVRDHRHGFYRLGDQAVVIPSFTGDGVALALASGSLAARMWLNGDGGAAYQRRFAHDVSAQMRSAVAIHRLMLAHAWRPWLMTICNIWPGLMSFVAQQTRFAALTNSGYAIKTRSSAPGLHRPAR